MPNLSRTFWYGFGYLICIPLFAYIYWLLPDGFYQSTIKIENSYTAHARNIADNFCRSAARLPYANEESIQTDHPTTKTFTVNDFVFAPSDMRCDNVRIEQDDRLGFTMKVTLHKKPPPCPEVLTTFCTDIFELPLLISLRPFDIKIMAPERIQFDPPLNAFFHPIKLEAAPTVLLVEAGGFDFGKGVEEALFSTFLDISAILLDERFDAELARFLKESSGITSASNDNGWRMLYLSAVTITTIGYGDIVPITPASRFFITMEAIVGAIFIGLFLNSLGGPKQS